MSFTSIHFFSIFLPANKYGDPLESTWTFGGFEVTILWGEGSNISSLDIWDIAPVL